MNLQQRIVEHQRIVILQVLKEAAGYDLNNAILQSSLNMYGLKISRDALATQLAWLVEQQLIETDTVGSLLVAKLLERGLDVASGHMSVPGVARPDPGS
jgi:hypothetical protein